MLWLPGLWVHSRLVKCYHKVFRCVFRLFIWLLFGFIFQYPICILSLLLLFDYLSSLSSSFKYPIYIFIVVVVVLVPLISQLISCFVISHKFKNWRGYPSPSNHERMLRVSKPSQSLKCFHTLPWFFSLSPVLGETGQSLCENVSI